MSYVIFGLHIPVINKPEGHRPHQKYYDSMIISTSPKGPKKTLQVL